MQSFIKIGVGSNATELEEKKSWIRNTVRSSHWNGKDLNKQKKYSKVFPWNGKDLNKQKKYSKVFPWDGKDLNN